MICVFTWGRRFTRQGRVWGLTGARPEGGRGAGSVSLHRTHPTKTTDWSRLSMKAPLALASPPRFRFVPMR